jgi:act minimal PKS acyl carrier protein
MTRQFTLIDLERILIEGTGMSEDVDLKGDILDSEFAELGYDSLSMLETSSRIQREFGISLDDNALAETATPRTLIAAINTSLGLSTSAS